MEKGEGTRCNCDGVYARPRQNARLGQRKGRPSGYRFAPLARPPAPGHPTSATSTRRQGQGFAPTEARDARVRKYPVDLAKARTMEREEGAVLVSMDGNPRHVNHRKIESWYVPDGTTSKTRSRGGGREIIVHAITRDGLRVGDFLVDEQGFPRKGGWFTEGGGCR